MKTLFAMFLVTVLASPAFAGPQNSSMLCQCRAQQKMYNQGETACLKTPQGQKLMQCVQNLNVTSWKKIQDGCGPEDSTS